MDAISTLEDNINFWIYETMQHPCYLIFQEALAQLHSNLRSFSFEL